MQDTKKTSTDNVLASKKRKLSRYIKIVLLFVLALAIAPLGYYAYMYAMSPAAIRDPAMDHSHFRMQVVVDGTTENFGNEPYQTPYAKDQCSGDLTNEPIHFHDNTDQFVHVHWRGITGGMVLKNYGWNFIGGKDAMLGYVLNDVTNIKEVPIHGNALPNIPNDATFFVYSGDANGYEQRQFDEWKNSDLESFFGTESNFPKPEELSLIDLLFPPAYAHDGSETNLQVDDVKVDDEALTKTNNLLGNVVIFVQSDAPTDEEIKTRFNNLVPLSDSTCGG